MSIKIAAGRPKQDESALMESAGELDDCPHDALRVRLNRENHRDGVGGPGPNLPRAGIATAVHQSQVSKLSIEIQRAAEGARKTRNRQNPEFDLRGLKNQVWAARVVIAAAACSN